MKGIKIVAACEEHIDDIVTIENLCFEIPWSRQSITEEIIENRIAIYMCAELDERIVGYAGMWQVCDEGHITNIAVHPEFRHSGVGSLLLESLLKAAYERGIAALTLEVRWSNLSALKLYGKYGFKEGGMRKAYYADNNDDAIIMWKRL